MQELKIVVDQGNTSFDRGQLQVAKDESERLLSVCWQDNYRKQIMVFTSKGVKIFDTLTLKQVSQVFYSETLKTISTFDTCAKGKTTQI